MSAFPFFHKDFEGSPGKKNPSFFGGFPCVYPTTMEKKIKAMSHCDSRVFSFAPFAKKNVPRSVAS